MPRRPPADRSTQVWILVALLLVSALLFGTVHPEAWLVISAGTLLLVVHGAWNVLTSFAAAGK